MTEECKILAEPDKVQFVNKNQGKYIQTITITNVHSEGLAFKMKSSSPTLFSMRPVHGVLGPNEKATVELMFKAAGKPIHTMGNQRFSIHYIISGDDTRAAREIWADRNKPSDGRKRIIVKFIAADDNVIEKKDGQRVENKERKYSEEGGKGAENKVQEEQKEDEQDDE